MSNDVDKCGPRLPVAGRKQDRKISSALDELRMLEPADVAMLLGVSKRQISRWLSAGDLPPYDFVKGQTKRWMYTTVHAWIRDQTGRQKKAS